MLQVNQALAIGSKDELPRIATLRHVVRNINRNDPSQTCHPPMLINPFSRDALFHRGRRVRIGYLYVWRLRPPTLASVEVATESQ